MRISPTNNTSSSSLLWRWSLALLWVCGFGLLAGASQSIPYNDNAGYPRVDTGPDIELLVHHESLTVTKRSHSTQDTHTKEGGDKPLWYLSVIYRFDHSCALLYRKSTCPAETIPLKSTITQQPAVPRAPPSV